MIHRSIIQALAPAAMLALAPPAFAQSLSPAESAAIDQAVTAALAATGTPSAQVAVVRDGRLVLSRAWGKASETIPVATADMPYQIASNSKQFLGALILMLQADGKLRLDDHVSKWLPGISGGRQITIRQLLTHTSGLQDFWPQDYLFPAMLVPTGPQGIVDRWAKKPLDYAPGTRWQYSNTGYVVAGLIAQKAGHAPLWRQFERRIFKPLHIRALPLDATNGPAFPAGYHRGALGPVRVAQPPARGWLWAAGELSMSAADLAKWDMARINRKLLRAADWRRQERPAILADGSDSQYGLGVHAGITDGRRVVNHGGESVGFLSQNTVYPDNRAAIVVLTNGDFADTQGTITKAVADIIMPRAAPADSGEDARTDDARAELAALTAGNLDASHFTTNAQSYFTTQTRADFAASLAPLGPLTQIKPAGPPRLRGGFVNRVFKLSYGSRKLVISTYAQGGAHGRWEQFLVMPDE